ncbi:MAG: hypothetical protein IJW44_01940 [Clostridia bacterium]|nr:hypothetical protein [Clostridia bacterium]
MNATPQNTDSIGYLIVKVSTARGAIPLADAAVNIRGGDPETSGVLYSLRTNRDGQTERVALPTPPRSASEAPGGIVPYANYNIEVSRPGYLPLSFQNVPVFPSITSIQPAVMIPQPEYAGTVPPADTTYNPPTVILPEDPETGL